MALEAVVTDSVVRVARSLHDFARGRGWSPEDYRISMTVNTVWDLARVRFVSDAFAGLTDAEQLDMYDDIMDKLESDLQDEPGLYRSLGLTLWPATGYVAHAYASTDPGRVEIPDALLEPEIEH